MKSVQELIALGKVPSDTTQAKDLTGYPNGWPIFTNIADQVKFDWDNLPSDRVRVLKGQPEYLKALNEFLLEPSAPVTDLSVPPSPVSVEEEVINPPAPVPPVAAEVPPASVEEVVPPAPVVPAATEETEGTRIDYPFGSIVKVKGGWEARIDNQDGSGVQVYKSKTKDELIGKLMQAQAHASQKIREQKLERDRLLAEEPADLAPVRRKLAPRALTADEQFEFAEALSSGDPTRINKAMAKRDEIVLGGSPAEVIGEVVKHQEQLEFESYKAVAKAFMKQNDDVIFSKELGDKIDVILAENKWAYTVRNLNKCLAQLRNNNEVTMKVSTPVSEEVELPIPTSSREAAPAAAAPVSTVAVPAVPAATPASQPKSTPAPASAAGERIRPGSASTGLSPRQASVRQGATPSAPVALTAEEYNRMSVSETRRKYKTDPGFRSSVDKLIAEGKI